MVFRVPLIPPTVAAVPHSMASELAPLELDRRGFFVGLPETAPRPTYRGMSDERNNVIPLPPQSRRFKADPSLELGYRVIPHGDPLESLSLQKLIDAIEDYGFESVASPLVNCAEYVELRRRIDIEALKPKPTNDHA